MLCWKKLDARFGHSIKMRADSSLKWPDEPRL